MELFFIAIILFSLVFQIVSAYRAIKDDEKNKAFSLVSIHLLIAVFISIILSAIIGFHADFLPSSGHGGFIHIIGPGIFGLIVFFTYLILLRIFPNSKFILGLVSILINISIGFYFLTTDF
jgi:hypothetical protein